ncbi:MAG TPA: hypothetical protein VKM55_25670 [Candidatus Lokiarchaeia archaeon]|nr:hypothetical protein [Candidatus Lokiarchaeia archaeon]
MSDEQEEMTLEELKAKLSQKDNEIQTLWAKLDEANVEEVEKIKEENDSLRKQVADLNAKVKSLESALAAAESAAPAMHKPSPVKTPSKSVIVPAKPVLAKPAVSVPKAPVAPSRPGALAMFTMPEEELAPELPDLESPEPSLAISKPEFPEELPEIEGEAAEKAALPLEELPDLEEGGTKEEPAPEEELPEIENKAGAEEGESLEELPDIEEAPEKPAKTAAPKTAALKPAPTKEATAQVKSKAEAVPMAKQAAPAPASGGANVSAFFNKEPTNPKKYVDEGFNILVTIAKSNHSGEEIGANLERFKEVLKDIVGFSQSMFPMTTAARMLRKSKGPLANEAVNDLLSNLKRWKGEIIDKIK